MGTVYTPPKAKTIYVVYNVEDSSELVAYDKLEDATADIEIGDDDVIAVYQLTGLIEVKAERKITQKKIAI